MRKKKLVEEQIALALREAEMGTPVAEVCRKMGVSEQSFYRLKLGSAPRRAEDSLFAPKGKPRGGTFVDDEYV